MPPTRASSELFAKELETKMPVMRAGRVCRPHLHWLLGAVHRGELGAEMHASFNQSVARRTGHQRCPFTLEGQEQTVL